jgi:Rrf2 family iron-sulfur cluster assembly transcriptional regulator
MIFSKATGYGIRALAYLASRAQAQPCGLREIAEHERIPPVYLRKVLGELRRHRLLRSTKGIHGGYELAAAPEAITLWEVFQVLDPNPELDLCILGHADCRPEVSCPLHEDWQRVRQEVIRLLQSRTISHIAAATATCQTRLVPLSAGRREEELF